MRWFKRLIKAPAATPRLEAPCVDENVSLKLDLAKRLHDQRARLHILEWQADVEGRRKGHPC